MSDPQAQLLLRREPAEFGERSATRTVRHWLQLTSFVFFSLPVIGAAEKIHRATHNEYPGQHWTQVSKPENRGWSSEKLATARAYADSIDAAAVVIVDHGVIVSQWGETTKKFNVHSIRKSFLSALYGVAVAKGEINFNATLDELGTSLASTSVLRSTI